MEILNNIPQPAPAPQAPSANSLSRNVSKAPAAVVLQQHVAVKPAQDSKSSNEHLDLKHADEKRFEQVKQAAKHFFRDVFVVSDRTFSIFKDASGQIVTRFTSLRDGKVTYIPEPDILEYMNSHSQAREALVRIEV